MGTRGVGLSEGFGVEECFRRDRDPGNPTREGKGDGGLAGNSSLVVLLPLQRTDTTGYAIGDRCTSFKLVVSKPRN